jgi:hypothetical protein
MPEARVRPIKFKITYDDLADWKYQDKFPKDKVINNIIRLRDKEDIDGAAGDYLKNSKENEIRTATGAPVSFQDIKSLIKENKSSTQDLRSAFSFQLRRIKSNLSHELLHALHDIGKDQDPNKKDIPYGASPVKSDYYNQSQRSLPHTLISYEFYTNLQSEVDSFITLAKALENPERPKEIWEDTVIKFMGAKGVDNLTGFTFKRILESNQDTFAKDPALKEKVYKNFSRRFLKKIDELGWKIVSYENRSLPAEKPVEKPLEKPVEKPLEKPVEQSTWRQFLNWISF